MHDRSARYSKPIRTLSLFSGAGGLDIGFHQAGYDIIACVEIDPSYCRTLEANLSDASRFGTKANIHCCDIRTFDASQYRDAGIRCVIGGPPCQTFSAAGRRSGGVIGTEDDRGQLFTAYCRILCEINPEVFVFENVYGLPGANGGKPWREIVKAFSDLGYRLAAEVVDAADYGVPQHRERLIMVGYRTNQFDFPLPTHGPDSAWGLPLVSVQEAIADLQDPDEPFQTGIGGLYGHLLPLVPEGLNYSFFTAEMGHPEPVFAWRSKFHDLLYKVAPGQPCRTIKAQPGKFTGPFHWKNRHFTSAELKRLQTFPDNYRIVGSYAKVMEQIGNSVPPRLAEVIAQSVREQLLDMNAAIRLPVRPPGFQSTFRQRQRARTHDFDALARSAIQAQYGARKAAAAIGRGALLAEHYKLNPLSLFDRLRRPPGATSLPGLPGYEVKVTEQGSHIELAFTTAHGPTGQASIEITGLRKYLPGFDTLSLSGRVARASDAFHAWAAIEEALTRRSRFFSLIDIYGHYANRGDTVKVSGRWDMPADKPFAEALNMFTSSSTCGDFIDERFLTAKLDLQKQALPTLVEAMREVRYDIRTSKTHPIIGVGRLLCTYPFPLLSPRALVESRARFIRPREQQAKPELEPSLL